MGEGEFNDVLVVNDALVFRFPRTPDGIERLRVELAVLGAVRGHVSVPVPDPVYVGVGVGTVGVAFMGYCMLPGQPLRTRLDAVKAGAACLPLAERLATFTKELHGVSARAVGLELPRHDRGRDKGLPELYEAVRERLYPHMRPDARERVTAQFGAYLADPSNFSYEPAIVHGDLGPGNILLDPDTLTVSGILDFGSAGLDDPAIDLGHLSFWGECLLGRSFVEQLYRSYPVVEPLLSRVRFFKVMIAMVVALEGLATGDRDAFEFGLAQYV